MKLIMKVKITVDICMVIVLLFLMSYSMAGDVVHEWLGIGMFILFILHHALNIKWWSSIIKGRYTMFRIIQTVLVITVLLAMAGSMASGVILSRPCTCLPSNKHQHVFCQKTAHGMCLPGIYPDVITSWYTLVYYYGHN